MKILFVIYDNGSQINDFPLAISYLAASLLEAGHEVKIYSSDVYHYPPEHLTEYLDKTHFDVVGFGFCGGYFQYKQFLKISEAVNKSINRKNFTYILGGPGPGAGPEYFLRKGNADFVCIGEGEKTIVELCAILGKVGREYLPQVNGLAYVKDGKLVKTTPRKLIEDLDTIPFPARDLFPIEHYVLVPYPNKAHTDRLLPMLTTRGCPYHCNFCYRYIPGMRFRKPEKVVEEMELLVDKYRVNYIVFFDELTMFPGKTEELCNVIINAKLDIKWLCNGRLNFAKPELLKLMKKSGCTFINYGIESYDNQVLKNMHKQLTLDVIDKGIKDTISEGISPGLNIIFGNYGDNAQTLQSGINFILKYNDYSQIRTIRPVTPYPGSELYYDAIKMGKLKDIADFYENKHKNSDLMTINYTDLTDEEFYNELYNANKILLNDHYEHQTEENDQLLKKMYLERDASFRGFRHT